MSSTSKATVPLRSACAMAVWAATRNTTLPLTNAWFTGSTCDGVLPAEVAHGHVAQTLFAHCSLTDIPPVAVSVCTVG